MEGFINLCGDIYRLKTPAGGIWSAITFIDGEKKILIDSGEKAQYIDELLVPALKSMGYQMTEIDYLFNTHCHGDHIGGHKRIVASGAPKVVTYFKSAPKLRDPLKYAKLIRAAFPDHSPEAPRILEGVEPDIIVKNNDMLADRLLLVASPGHDDDAVCFYDTKTKALISGDSLQGNGTVTQGTAFYMDVDDYRNSIKHIREMDIEYMISGHSYLSCQDKAVGREEVKKYLDCCYDVTVRYENYIREQVNAGETDVVRIAEGLIRHMDNKKPAKLFLPLYTVTAHMKKLQKENN